MKETIRLRTNAEGLQVWNAGKWVPADQRVAENVFRMLRDRFPSL
jgi:hypothetical protein